MKYPEYLNSSFVFFNDTATTEIYTLSLHDALPISSHGSSPSAFSICVTRAAFLSERSTRSEEHTSELQSHSDLVCRLLLEKKKGRTVSSLASNALPPGSLDAWVSETARPG